MTALLQYGTPGIVLVLLILNVVQLQKTSVLDNKVHEIRESVNTLKDRVVFRDTHDETERVRNVEIANLKEDVDRLNRHVLNGHN